MLNFKARDAVRIISQIEYHDESAKKKKKRSVKRTLVCLITSVIGLLIYKAGDFLVFDEPPIVSDVIIVLSGEDATRMDKAISLYRKGYADKILLSNAKHSVMLENANRSIPPSSIIKELNATSTTENAEFTKQIIEDNNFKTIIVISSDYHMRRVKINFDKTLKENNVTIRYVSSRTRYNPDNWWGSKYDLGITLSEYIKLLGNVLGIHGTSAKEKLYKFDNYFLGH